MSSSGGSHSQPVSQETASPLRQGAWSYGTCTSATTSTALLTGAAASTQQQQSQQHDQQTTRQEIGQQQQTYQQLKQQKQLKSAISTGTPTRAAGSSAPTLTTTYQRNKDNKENIKSEKSTKNNKINNDNNNKKQQENIVKNKQEKKRQKSANVGQMLKSQVGQEQHKQQEEHIGDGPNEQQASTASSGGGSFGFDKTDIEQVLKSETARAPFQQFLQQQFCAENINFYLAVEEYRQIPDSRPEERAEFGRQIFERHFASNCIEPVNIDNSTANSIREGYKLNRFTSDLYDVVQYQIFHLLKYDCWPRYLRAGGQFAEEFGSGGDATAGATSGKRAGFDTQNKADSQSQRASSKRRDGSSRRKSLFQFLRDRLNVAGDSTNDISTSDDAPTTNNALNDSTSVKYRAFSARQLSASYCSTGTSSIGLPRIDSAAADGASLVSSSSSSCLISAFMSSISNDLRRTRPISARQHISSAVNIHNSEHCASDNGQETQAQNIYAFCEYCKNASTSLARHHCDGTLNDGPLTDSGCDALSSRASSIRKSANVTATMSSNAHRLSRTRYITTNSDAIDVSWTQVTGESNPTSPTDITKFDLCAESYDQMPSRLSISTTSDAASDINLERRASQDQACHDFSNYDECCCNCRCYFASNNTPALKQQTTPLLERRRGSSGLYWSKISPNACSPCRIAAATDAIASPKTAKRRRSMAALGRRLSAGLTRKLASMDNENGNDNAVSSTDSATPLHQCHCQEAASPLPAFMSPMRRSMSCSPYSTRPICTHQYQLQATSPILLSPTPQSDLSPKFTLIPGYVFGDVGGAHQHYRHSALREPATDGPAKTCTLLSAECGSSSEITLTDQLQSVKQWAAQMAESCGLDKNASEVVDAQTGATIDPARQAVDALNNRTVRLMAVVRFPVIFLAPTSPNAASSSSSSSSFSSSKSPLPAKVVILRARSALTVNKVLTPMMLKYNVTPAEAVVCFAGTVDIVERQTPVGAFCPRPLTVMSHAQYMERKALTKRDYQKELNIVPLWLCSVGPSTSLGANAAAAASATAGFATASSLSGGLANTTTNASNAAYAMANSADAANTITFHQHGDVGFFEMPLEADAGKSLKHNATRSHSSNPKEFFKFGRKPSQAKSARGAGFGGGIASAFPTGGTSSISGCGSSDHHDSHHHHHHQAHGSSGGGGGGGSPGDISRHVHPSHTKLASGSSYGSTDRRKSLGATAMGHSTTTVGTTSGVSTSSTIAVGGSSSGGNSYKIGSATKMTRPTPQVEKSDIPYCGDEALTTSNSAPLTYPISLVSTVDATKSNTTTTTTNARGATPTRFLHHHAYCYDMPEFLKTDLNQKSGGANGATARLPAIYASKVRGDKETPAPCEVIEGGLEWQKADYV